MGQGNWETGPGMGWGWLQQLMLNLDTLPGPGPLPGSIQTCASSKFGPRFGPYPKEAGEGQNSPVTFRGACDGITASLCS